MIIAFNKPFGMLSQFTAETGSSHDTLASVGLPEEYYPIGRLDADSEGLLLLTNERGLQSTLLEPTNAHGRTYWTQVEGVPTSGKLIELENGVDIAGRRTLPCNARMLDPQPDIAERTPPVRIRKSVPTTWIELVLTEGKNRQVRKMTAAVGYPTLRLIRVGVGGLLLSALDIGVGQWRPLTGGERDLVFSKTGTANN